MAAAEFWRPHGISGDAHEDRMLAKKSLFELARALEGLPVLGALAGTPAARAGIRYGDVLISVNGRRTRTILDYMEAKSLRNDGMEIVVFRTGEEHAAELTFAEHATPINPATLLAELVSMRIALGDDDGILGAGRGGGRSGTGGPSGTA